MKHVVKNIHFVGIGGSGMSGIAEVLLNLGYCVSGSDLNRTTVTARLAALGARIALGHQAEHIGEANAVVVSSAIRADNPEVLAARQRGIPLVPRAAMLAELMRLKQGIAIAGTHGKTTTTSLVASILARGGFDPTFVIGGRLNSAGANARLGTGDFIVAEADESDASFLNLFPVIEVITNIDMDHMETYGHDFTKLKQAFIEFTQRLPFYGIAVLCVDDPHVCEILPAVTKPIVRYGLSEQAQVRAVEIRAEAGRMHFTVLRADAAPLAIELNLPGLHNVRNALAAIAIATELEVADEAICQALAEFTGVDRRFQRYGEIPLNAGGSYTLIDDYGHHPVEMAATIAAARGAFVGRRLVLAFQPHRFTRTRDCFKDFVNVLSNADAVILTEVYSAGEAPIAAADGQALVRALRTLGKVEAVFAKSIEAMPEVITQQARAGDVVITMGAGSMGHVPVWLTQSHS